MKKLEKEITELKQEKEVTKLEKIVEPDIFAEIDNKQLLEISVENDIKVFETLDLKEVKRRIDERVKQFGDIYIQQYRNKLWGKK